VSLNAFTTKSQAPCPKENFFVALMKRQTQNTIKPKTGPYTILEKKLFGSCFDKNEEII
jgi:hypothetical protein